jgi:hypothetical protein
MSFYKKKFMFSLRPLRSNGTAVGATGHRYNAESAENAEKNRNEFL